MELHPVKLVHLHIINFPFLSVCFQRHLKGRNIRQRNVLQLLGVPLFLILKDFSATYHIFITDFDLSKLNLVHIMLYISDFALSELWMMLNFEVESQKGCPVWPDIR